MKKLILKVVIVTILAIGIFATVFSLKGGWQTQGAARYEMALSATLITAVAASVAMVALTASVWPLSLVAVLAASVAMTIVVVATFLTASVSWVAVAAVVALTLLLIAFIAVLVARGFLVSALWESAKEVNAVISKGDRGKVYTYLILIFEWLAIFASMMAMTFL